MAVTLYVEVQIVKILRPGMGHKTFSEERVKHQKKKQLGKYEDWIREVERRQVALARNRDTCLRVFYALPFLSLVAFFRDVGNWCSSSIHGTE
jgi:hypothetical protein